MLMRVGQQNLVEKLAARAENYFVSFYLFIVTTDKSYISKVLVIYQTFESVLCITSKLIPRSTELSVDILTDTQMISGILERDKISK